MSTFSQPHDDIDVWRVCLIAPETNFPPRNVSVNSAGTVVTAMTPAHAPGLVGVFGTNPNGQAGGPISYTYTASTSTGPVILNNGQATTWTSRQTTTGNAAYSPLQIRITQSGSSLVGSNRDNARKVDVQTSGTIDSSGRVVLSVILSNGGSPRQSLSFNGTVSGTGANQTISGTYSASNPTEAGTFTMNHN